MLSLVRAQSTNRLLTIPLSHFCEKARWALDRSGVPYIEERHLQIFHYPHVRRAGGPGSVPVLVTGDGVLADSTDILAWIHRAPVGAGGWLFPADEALRREVAALEERFDETLGPVTRRVAYAYLMPERALTYRYNCTGVPAWERMLLPLAYPFARRMLARKMTLTDQAVRDAEASVDRGLDEVGARLADGRRYLVGDAFTAADLTFAALAAPVLLPAEYGVPLPGAAEVPTAFGNLVNKWRATVAGRFALRLYAEERRKAVTR
jgi:glutathione S-transferase